MRKLYFVARHFAVNTGSYAGFIEEVSKYASNNGYKVTILSAKTAANLQEYEKHEFGEVIRFKIPLIHIPLLGMNKDYYFLSKKVSKYFKENKLDAADVVIANTRGAYGLKNCKFILRMGQPARLFLRNMEIAKDEVTLVTRVARFIHFSLQHHLEKNCYSKASGYIFSSVESMKQSTFCFGNHKKPYFIPHSGVKYADFQNGKKRKIQGKVLLFVSAGTEKIRKGIIYLEKALPVIFESHPDVKLLHVGEKFDWNVPDKYRPRIISVGKIEWNQMKDYYATADILLNCALNEWIPNVIYEGMAAGLPVVTSDIEGIQEVIEHKKTGYIYKRGTVEGIIQGINFILAAPGFRKNASPLLKSRARKINYPQFSKSLLDFASDTLNGRNINSVNMLK